MSPAKATGLLVVVLMCILVTVPSWGCDQLQSSNADQLVSYLAGIVPKEQDAKCIVYAIDRLGEHRYQPAIPALTRWLFLRWPRNARRLQIRDAQPGSPLSNRRPEDFGLYPAADALEKIGPSALPLVLETIKADSSGRMLEPAVLVWMHFYEKDAPTGVALLKREADLATDAVVKKRLNRAALRAPLFCSPAEQAQCRAAGAGR